VPRELRLLVRPDTVLRWYRNLLARRHAAVSRPKSPGRPRTVRSIRTLVLRLVRENRSWGYRRVHGELLVLDVRVAASTVSEILHEPGINPAPDRASSTWANFLRSQAEALQACDFIETVTLAGTRLYVLAGIEHASRRVRVLGATAHPTATWVAQAARNLVMDLEDAGCRANYVIRDRDGKFPPLFDTILADAGIRIVLTGVQIPRMNAIMERWVQTCRRELLDRTLVWNERHLVHALREYERFYNHHRLHQGLTNSRPLTPLPTPITDLGAATPPRIHRHDHLGGILHESERAAWPARMTSSASTGSPGSGPCRPHRQTRSRTAPGRLSRERHDLIRRLPAGSRL
jgi:putative transposase